MRHWHWFVLLSLLPVACGTSAKRDGGSGISVATPGERDDNEGAPAATAEIDPVSTGRELASPRDEIPGAKNFAQISPALYRSAQPTAEGFQELKKRYGIKTVVSLRVFHSDRDELEGTGIQYKRISFKPWHAEDEDVLKFLKIVNDRENQPVLVHCLHGSDRTGTMVAVYRFLEQGWEMEEAMQELPRFGFHKIFRNLKSYLLKLDRDKLRKKLADEPAPGLDTIE